MNSQKIRQIATVFRPDCAQLFVILESTGAPVVDPDSFLKSSGLGDRNIIVVREHRRSWYLSEIEDGISGITDLCNYIKRISGLLGVQEIYVVGVCMGAWSAMLAGRILQCNRVWAFAPTPPDAQTLAMLNAQHIEVPDLLEALRQPNACGGFEIFYCEDSSDKDFAEKFSNIENVKLISVPGSSHNVMSVLKREGRLRPLFPIMKRISKNG